MKLKKLDLKNMSLKKKLLLGWLALELMSLPIAIPAAAQMVDKVMFSAPPRAVFVEINPQAGVSQLIVASNAPFRITTQGAVGELSVTLSVNGQINGTPFGTKAQNPGPALGCVFAASAMPTPLYTAARKTAERRGEVIEQAVMVEISYDPALSPTFKVETMQKNAAMDMPSTLACSSISS